jgi:hypothetical protein
MTPIIPVYGVWVARWHRTSAHHSKILHADVLENIVGCLLHSSQCNMFSEHLFQIRTTRPCGRSANMKEEIIALLKTQIIELLENCQDEGLLDLVCKLLVPEG